MADIKPIQRKVSPDEPEGGWLSPGGGNGWPDLEELDRKQLASYAELDHRQRAQRRKQR